MLNMDSTEIPVYGQEQHSAQNGREAQPRALADFLRSEERLENMSLGFFIHGGWPRLSGHRNRRL
jgi:hypothetical protein